MRDLARSGLAFKIIMGRERVNTDAVFFSRPCFRDVLNLLSESLTQGGWRNTADFKKVLVIGRLKQIRPVSNVVLPPC